MSTKCIGIVVVFVSAIVVADVGAHSGRLDANGGHHDRKRGGYHYHRSPQNSSSSYLSPRIEPRTSYRSEKASSARTESRSSFRAEAKTFAREATPRRRNYDWNYHSHEKAVLQAEAMPPSTLLAESSAAVNDNGTLPTIIYYQVQKTTEGETTKMYFVAVRGEAEGEFLREEVPSDSEVAAHARTLKLDDGDSKYFLNGMSRSEPPWARSVITSNEIAVWTRAVEPDEFVEKHLIKLVHPLRVWTDKSGKHKRTARFYSRSGNELILLGADGLQIAISLDKLSEDDIEYLSNK